MREKHYMTIPRILVVSAALLATTFLFGCGISGGADVKTSSSSTTLGQELKDLKEAHDQKIISDGEYEEAKARIIKQRTSN
jgi:hypothetical protein